MPVVEGAKPVALVSHAGVAVTRQSQRLRCDQAAMAVPTRDAWETMGWDRAPACASATTGPCPCHDSNDGTLWNAKSVSET